MVGWLILAFEKKIVYADRKRWNIMPQGGFKGNQEGITCTPLRSRMLAKGNADGRKKPITRQGGATLRLAQPPLWHGGKKGVIP